MPVRFLILILCLSPGLLFATQEVSELDIGDNDLELFEFIASYEKNDTVFIDSEIEDKTNTNKQMSHKVNMSKSDE